MTDKFTTNLWNKALTLEKKLVSMEKEVTRSIIQEAFCIPQSLAQHIIFALGNKDILKLSPDKREFNNKKVLVINDIHIPFQDNAALEAALSFAEKEKVNSIIINGDLIDFYKISRFSKDPRRKSATTEIKETKLFLTELRNRFKDVEIIYKEGNHDLRLQKYLMDNAGEVYELLDGLFEKVLNLENLNIEYIIDPFRLGKLWFFHGHEKAGGGSGGEHICDNVFKLVYDSFVVGHFHRSQDKVFRTINKETAFKTFAVGYLAGDMEYAKINKWNQGFLILDFSSDGCFRGQPYTILNGEVY